MNSRSIINLVTDGFSPRLLVCILYESSKFGSSAKEDDIIDFLMGLYVNLDEKSAGILGDLIDQYYMDDNFGMLDLISSLLNSKMDKKAIAKFKRFLDKIRFGYYK